MPALQNSRWELMAISLAQGKSQIQSYKDAGFAPEGAPSNAATLAKRPEVGARVAELIEERTQFKANFTANGDLEHLGQIDKVMETGEIDRRWIITQLMENVKDARDAGQFSASNKALELLGKEIGMFQDKSKAPPDDPTKTDALPAPVSVEAINRLLESVGYAGPPIDLTSTVNLPVIQEDKKKNAKSARS